GEAGVHDAVGHLVGKRNPAVEQVFEPRLLGLCHALVEAGERLARIEIGRVDSVAGRPQRVREGDNTAGQPLRMMKQKNLSHTQTTLFEPAGATSSPRATKDRPRRPRLQAGGSWRAGPRRPRPSPIARGHRSDTSRSLT